MTFPEKSALTMTAILLAVFSGYFALVLGPVAGAPGRNYGYVALMALAAVLITALAAVSHIILAIVFHRQVGVLDERDRLIGLRSTRVASYLLGVGVCTGIGLAVVRVDAFWIAQVLVAALVLAEISKGVVTLALYRRGA